MNPIAAWLDGYRADLRTAIAAAADDGYRRLQAATTGAELNPAGFSGSARRHLARHLRSLGMDLDALAVAAPGGGLADPHYAQQRLELLRGTLEMCRDMAAPAAVATLGGFGAEATRGLAREMLAQAAELSTRTGISLAIESGTDDPSRVAEEIRRLGCPTLRAAADVATLWPLKGDAPGEALRSVYLRDFRVRPGGIEETEIGAGEVDLAALLRELAGGAFSGSYVIRWTTPPAVDAARRGRETVESTLRALG